MARVQKLFKSQWPILLGILLILVVVFIGLAIFYDGRASELDDVGVAATATVTDKFESERVVDNSQTEVSLDFSYEWELLDGSTHRHVAAIPDGDWNAVTIGETADVFYNPDNPAQHNSPWGTQSEVADLWIGMAMLAFLLFLFLLPIGLWRVGRTPAEPDTDLVGDA